MFSIQIAALLGYMGSRYKAYPSLLVVPNSTLTSTSAIAAYGGSTNVFLQTGFESWKNGFPTFA